VTLDSVVHEFIQGATDELGQVILRKILSLGLGLQLEVPFANAPAQRLDPRPVLCLSPNSPGFLFAASQILADAVLVLKIVRDRTVYFAKAETGKVILDLLGQ